jgi:hypothetical protein
VFYARGERQEAKLNRTWSNLLVGLAALALAAVAQDKVVLPDFSGMWKTLPGKKGDVLTRIIVHKGGKLGVATSGRTPATLDCDLEREECTEEYRSLDPQGQPTLNTRKKLAKWDGGALVLSTLIGGAIAGREEWRLSSDGKTLSIRINVFVPSPGGGREIDAGVVVWQKQE